jgi:hypothetical protein
LAVQRNWTRFRVRRRIVVVIAQLPSSSEQRFAKCLIAWWIGSLVALAGIWAYYFVPVDAQFQWLLCKD